MSGLMKFPTFKGSCNINYGDEDVFSKDRTETDVFNVL